MLSQYTSSSTFLGLQGTQLTTPVVWSSGEAHCFLLDYEVLEANVYTTMISQESKHCFGDKCRYKYSDKEPKLGNEHFGPLESTYHNQRLLAFGIVSLYRVS